MTATTASGSNDEVNNDETGEFRAYGGVPAAMASDPPPLPPPQLELTDIIVPLSPTPELVQLASGHATTHDNSSAFRMESPLRNINKHTDIEDEQEAQDLQAMRNKASDVLSGSFTSGYAELSVQEFAEMVMQLSTSEIRLRSQVYEQAETIAHLLKQHELLVERMEEEKGRWDAERESWNRTAEVLIAQASRSSGNIYKEQTEYSKLPALIESENVTLKQKVSDMQLRQSLLESELSRLRPILLMNPNALAQSNYNKKDDTSIFEPGVLETIIDLRTGEPATPKGKRKGGQYYRSKEDKVNAGSNSPKKKTGTLGKAPLSSDARAEHLLLAARRIGRQRASLLSVSVPQNNDGRINPNSPSPSKGKDSIDKIESGSLPVTPKTPQKSPTPFKSPALAFPTPGHPYLLQSPSVPHTGNMRPPPYAYVPGPVPGHAYFYSPYGYTPMAYSIPSPSRGGKAAGVSFAIGPSRIPTMPSPSTTPTAPGQWMAANQPGPSGSSTTKESPLTPFDKLLSAAETVFSPSKDVITPTPIKGKGKGKADPKTTHLVELEDSPTPKKRRRIQSSDANEGDDSDDLSRKASALDVLADQAMASESNPISSQTRSLSESPVDSEDDDKNRPSVIDLNSPKNNSAKGSPSKSTHASRITRSAGGRDKAEAVLDPPISLSRSSSKEKSSSSRRSIAPSRPSPRTAGESELGKSPNTRSSTPKSQASKQRRPRKSKVAPEIDEEKLQPESEEEDDENEIDQLDEEAYSSNTAQKGEAPSNFSPSLNDELRKRWLQKLGHFSKN